MVKYTHESKETWKRELEDGSFEMYAIIYDEAGGYPLWHVGGGHFHIEDFDNREVTAAIEQVRPTLNGTTARFNLASALFDTYFIDVFQREDFTTHEAALAWVKKRIGHKPHSDNPREILDAIDTVCANCPYTLEDNGDGELCETCMVRKLATKMQ